MSPFFPQDFRRALPIWKNSLFFRAARLPSETIPLLRAALFSLGTSAAPYRFGKAPSPSSPLRPPFLWDYRSAFQNFAFSTERRPSKPRFLTRELPHPIPTQDFRRALPIWKNPLFFLAARLPSETFPLLPRRAPFPQDFRRALPIWKNSLSLVIAPPAFSLGLPPHSSSLHFPERKALFSEQAPFAPSSKSCFIIREPPTPVFPRAIAPVLQNRAF